MLGKSFFLCSLVCRHELVMSGLLLWGIDDSCYLEVALNVAVSQSISG